MFTPSVEELDILRNQFVEATTLHGRIAEFYQIDHIKWNRTDPDVQYLEPVKVSYTLDANPSTKTISRYGWFKEDQTELPVIAYITYHDIENKPIKIEEQCLIDITAMIDTLGASAVHKFKVQRVATDLELNQAVLNLIPYRETLKAGVRQLETVADPTLEHKFVQRDEVWSKKVEG